MAILKEREGNYIEKSHPLKITRVHAGMAIKNVSVEFTDFYKTKYDFVVENAHIAGLICKKTSKIFGEPLVAAESSYLSGLKADLAGEYTPTSNYTGDLDWLRKDYADDAETEKGWGVCC